MDNLPSSEYEMLEALVKLIKETIDTNQKQDSTLNLLSTLWIVLFLLIIVQKVFKYVIKPWRQNQQQQQQRADDERDPSNHCLVL